MDIAGSDVLWLVPYETISNVSTIFCDDFRITLTGKIGSEGFLDDLFSLKTVALTDLDNVLKQQRIFLKEKSRVRWLAEGDQNSKSFHPLLKRKWASKTLSIIQIGENISNDPVDIGEHVSSCYQYLFSDLDSSSSNLSIIREHVSSLVTVDENTSILRVPSFDEVRNTVFTMDPLSAPGPDDFSSRFYSHCWEIVGHDVVLAVQYFFHFIRVFSGLNSNFLVLILKTPNTLLVVHFHLIALGYPLIDLVKDRFSLRPPLGSVVGDIYSDVAGWDIPASFKASYPDVAYEIEKVVVSTDPDSLVWTCSSDGVVSCKSDYDSLSEVRNSVFWIKQIWTSLIPYSRPVLVWSLFHGKIPTDIALHARGYVSPSHCRFCCVVEEDLRRQFLNCPFVHGLWDVVSSTFSHMLKLNGTCLDPWQEAIRIVFSTQLKAHW
ncbi:hypothetical protein Ddye_006569 [Dipteronia dyeriana]|uniref:Reverse transcriptase zinc-binding domain-containing protein n=1 Tax=Dipteronia dyeriana TaxID=168575 RepID=A0AAD9XIW5_9ROSI|nr:hypothetical protein Ddye_006569 [Dipteronia dyeriana]